ncbi:MAG TPA: RNA polymerase factor sigma-54 [Desulfovibrio sp.]|uniref:RNA polymerase factor sigma-54 n=1 Tax=Desulfovibrio sp. TaxID=885 RepID=UPI002D4B3507|nr:RNA polymerase factor sigma-54 [Desulfovibrio sp.]HZF60770.1 RNA polymerase factor sigma-54 [Desulfovibrio sp.]
MALELRQQLKLSQQLVMTPQLQQAIKLLQLSRVELLETVQQELLENPFLEESSLTDDASQEQHEESREAPKEEVYDRELAKDADWEDYLGEFASTPRLSQSREFELAEEISPLEARYAAKPTLEGHLFWQLRLSSLTEEQKAIGEVIIGNLSSAGYLQASIEEVAEMAQVAPEAVLPVLERVQLFDPIGVAARDARECLMVQIKSLNYARDPILVELVESHLEDLEAKRYKPLLRKFKLDMEELKEYLDIIQSLDPLPGASFGGGEPTYVSPDVFVYKMGDEFVILLNDDGLPQLQLSAMSQMNIGNSDKEKDYCSEKIRSASWLIKSLYQRQRTLYKVMESIVRHQQPFFEDGVTKLAPLILKDIADDISMHESTVSRITTNKYVATPHGIFELKFFFNSGLELDDGSQVGSESVKALIKKFISEEDTRSPLSDERIGEMLKERLKVNIARRTVAKYRTALDIPSSSRRKEHF